MEPSRLKLARIPTPLESVEGLSAHRSLLIKRDDLTGSALTGNKVRKLEYLLAEALSQGAKRVITCGGIQSNHCRATAVAAARLGLNSLLFLRTSNPPAPGEPATGNLKLDQLMGAEIRFINPDQYKERNLIMSETATSSDYVIPEGGSNALGAWGYIRAVDELQKQWSEPPTSIVCATGSGGTLAGLMIGLRRRGLDIWALGVCVCDDATYFSERVAEISAEATSRWTDLPQIAASDVKIVEGYVGRGYALSTAQELDDIASVARRSGLVLDPVYSGKAFRALQQEPDRFGDRPLFIHTGGIFGLLA